MKVYESIARTLHSLGVGTMFGLVGDGNLLAVHSYTTGCGGRYVSAANEAAAVLMAIGYSATSSELGVATVTHGPGLTNTVTALVHGVRSRTPVVLLAADTATADSNHLQNICQRDITASTGAGFEQLQSPITLAQDVSRACTRALHERRPIVLNMPTDLKMLETETGEVPLLSPAAPRIAPDAAAMDAAVGLIANSKRPIVLAGRGATNSLAKASLLRLADRTGAPVATTLKAKDLFRSTPYDLGLFGTLSTPATVEAILDSDCIIAFGASLNDWTTASGAYASGRRVVHCDIEAAQIGRYTPVDAALVGDAAFAADTIVAWLDEAQVPATSFRSNGLAGLADVNCELSAGVSGPDGVDIYSALRAIEGAVPSDRTAVFDAGRFVIPALKTLHVSEPRAWVTTLDFASIGLAMPTAIGAAYGRPGHPVLVVTGDGGFMLGGLAEFNTAVRHGVDLVVAVLNDGSYGAELRHLRAHGLDTALSQFDWPDFAPLAVSLGGEGIAIRSPADLVRLPTAVAGRRAPLLIDFKLDPFNVPAPETG